MSLFTENNWQAIEDEFRKKQIQRLLGKPTQQKDQVVTVTASNEVYQSANSIVPPDNAQIQANDNALTAIDSGIEAGQNSGVQSSADSSQNTSSEAVVDAGAGSGPDSDAGAGSGPDSDAGAGSGPDSDAGV